MLAIEPRTFLSGKSTVIDQVKRVCHQVSAAAASIFVCAAACISLACSSQAHEHVIAVNDRRRHTNWHLPACVWRWEYSPLIDAHVYLFAHVKSIANHQCY